MYALEFPGGLMELEEAVEVMLSHRNYLFGIARKFTVDSEVEDVVSNAMVKCIVGFKSFMGSTERDLLTWVGTVVKNCGRDVSRSSRLNTNMHMSAIPFAENQAFMLSECEALNHIEEDSEVAHILSYADSNEDKIIMYLFFVQDFEHGELAKMFGISPTAMKSRIFRIKTRIREKMEMVQSNENLETVKIHRVRGANYVDVDDFLDQL